MMHQRSYLTFPLAFKTRGVESRIVVDGRSPSRIDKTLVDGIALAHACLKALTDGSSKGIAEVAADRSMDASDVSRILPLAFLAPSLTEAILTGRQPADLTLRKLTRIVDLPIDWRQQMAMLA